jgi:hypothetical protein
LDCNAVLVAVAQDFCNLLDMIWVGQGQNARARIAPAAAWAAK